MPKTKQKQEKNVERVDTIPASLKSYFFAEKEPPRLLQDYDAVGFDADTCLVKYNMEELVKLVTVGHMKQLV